MSTRNVEVSYMVASIYRCVLLLSPLFVTGCYSINVVKCSIPDTEANRRAGSKIVAEVAIKHGFVEGAKQSEGVELLSCYEYLDDPAQGLINLSAYAYQGAVTARLSQTKKSKVRTPRFLNVEQDLISGFKENFGNGVEIRIYNEEMPP